jgi:hypothetical protein
VKTAIARSAPVTVAEIAADLPAAATTAVPRGPWIAGPRYDAFFFLAPPILALAVGAVVGLLHLDHARFWYDGRRVGWTALGLGALVNAHLVAVLFRSHGNRDVFGRHPLRFLLVPPLLVATIASSSWAMIVSAVVVVFWDVHHSALQTFGLGRIYERNAGNPPDAGRRLDLWLNVVLYVGPIVGGASMLAHVDRLGDLEEVGLAFFSVVPAFMEREHQSFALGALALGVAVIVAYVVGYARLERQGHRIAWPKVWLLASTGVCSLIAWGTNPWGQAFLIMNLFHAVQYLGLVWWVERPRLARVFRLGPLAPFGFVVAVAVYGVWAELVHSEQRLAWAVTQTVALLHFWYDGFVWSVTRRHV